MARINSYPYDAVVKDNDAWIGTEASNRRTKQYTAKAVAEYLNEGLMKIEANDFFRQDKYTITYEEISTEL